METISSFYIPPILLIAKKFIYVSSISGKSAKRKNTHGPVTVTYMMDLFPKEIAYLCIYTTSQEHIDSKTHPWVVWTITDQLQFYMQ